MCAEKERNMSKKHGFALILALFVAAGTVVATTGAEAAPKKNTHICVAKHGKKCHVRPKHHHRHHHHKVADSADQVAETETSTAPVMLQKDSVAWPTITTPVQEKTMTVADEYVGLNVKQNRNDLIQLFSVTLNDPVDPKHTPWCAAFVNAILAKVGVDGSGSLEAGSFLDWGQKTKDPKPGDVVVLSFNRRHRPSHVGFYVEDVDRDGKRYIKVLGGNQGHGVQMAYYPVKTVLQYRTQ
jgi:uncharacterized protein (TIGR02594 family)